jgi:threonine dehydratase
LRRTGSFKFAALTTDFFNPAERRAAGVVAYSSAIMRRAWRPRAPARSARDHRDAERCPKAKRERTLRSAPRSFHDGNSEDRAAIAKKIVPIAGLRLCRLRRSADHRRPGTIGAEIVEDLAQLSLPEVVVVGASGSGLAAGISLGVKAGCRRRVLCRRTGGFDDTLRSFASGKREANARMSGTICDALMSTRLAN